MSSAEYSTVDVGPTEWRRLFAPVGAVWVATLGTVLVVRNDVTIDPTSWEDAVPAALAVILGWLAVGLIALSLGWAVERVWLNRWPRLGAGLARRRRDRWRRYHEATLAAYHANDRTAAARWARRRNAIASAEPECPGWMADRWASVTSRVHNAYGLHVGPAWPRLWLTLPAEARADVRLAAAQWHRTCAWAAWAVLYALLAVVWWPALAVAGVLAVWAHARARTTLAYRADMIEATFDVHGSRLAEAMGVELPPPGRLTPAVGEEIMARIRKGT
jgi:hypothetical protein